MGARFVISTRWWETPDKQGYAFKEACVADDEERSPFLIMGNFFDVSTGRIFHAPVKVKMPREGFRFKIHAK